MTVVLVSCGCIVPSLWALKFSEMKILSALGSLSSFSVGLVVVLVFATQTDQIQNQVTKKINKKKRNQYKLTHMEHTHTHIKASKPHRTQTK